MAEWTYRIVAFCVKHYVLFGIFASIDLKPMAATGAPPRDFVIALVFTAAAAAAMASTFGGGGGGVAVCNIVALLGESGG